MTPQILVVDDDKYICTILTEFVRRMGYAGLPARNGEEALKILANPECQPISLVLTDFWMPSMSGIELLEAVRGYNPDIPVIIISGAATKESAIAAVNAGAFKYLEKPYDRNQLTEAIEGGLRRYEDTLNRRELMKRYSELERRATEQLQNNRQAAPQSNDTLERLIHGLNHELGNVTQAIQMNLSVLAEQDRAGTRPADIREHLEDLRISVDELVALLTKLREYPQKGLQPQTLALGVTLGSMIESARNRAQKLGVHMTVHAPENEIYVFGAALELRKAFGHILENAFEAVDNRQDGTIALTFEAEEDGAVITVSDNGPGFNREVLDQPFSPAKTGKLREGFVRGLSLGLFITRALIDIQNGTIQLANHAEGGAIVRIRLPLAPEMKQVKSDKSDPIQPTMYFSGIN